MYKYVSAVLVLLMPTGVWAQTSDPVVSTLETPTDPGGTDSQTTTPLPINQSVAAPPASFERIEVTGSHIKRIEVEGVSPVEMITRKELEKTGSNSIADVLRETTANSFGSLKEEAGSNAAGVAHVDLRGLGSSNTLVLLNGQRLPSDAVTGAVDLNLIPMAAIERVEILKDGASAIYGSDALGGVVNIITRKDFSGSEVSAATTIPELPGGKRQDVSVVNGFNTKNMNVVNVVQYRDNQGIMSKERDWTNNGISTIGSPGAYRSEGGSWVADGTCPADRIRVTPGGTLCEFKYSDFSSELPILKQISALSEANIQLDSKTRLKARINGTQKKINWSYAPAPGTFVIPADVAERLGPGGTPLPGSTPGKDLQVRYRLTELGTRDSEVTTNSYNLLLGINRELGNSWELSASTSQNRIDNHDQGINGYALTSDLTSAIESGTFNPFAPAGQKGVIEGARYKPLEETVSILTSADVKASGEIGELTGGPVGLAVGSSFTFQRYEDKFDEKSIAGEVFGNAGSSGAGQRETQALFTELSLPVTKKLELQLAARHDQYSDFGSSTNPKAAFLYRANNSLLLRGSVGTGFKAPLMQDMYAATSMGYPTFVDVVSCQREIDAGGPTQACTPQQYQVTSSGNTGLKEEKSISYNVGAIYEPSTDFSIGTDLFLTKLKNVVGIDYAEVMTAEAQGIDVSKYGVKINRDASGYIDSIEAPLQNLSARELTGIDLNSSYKVGRFQLKNDYSRLFNFKEEGFPGMGLNDRLGDNGRPAWRNSATVGYAPSDKSDISVVAKTIASHSKGIKESGSIPEYTSVDIQYKFSAKGFGTLIAGVKNVAGTTPPLDDSNPNRPLDATLYDQIGRQFFTTYKASF